MTDETYGRGQVELALWNNFVGKQHSRVKDIPTIFKARIKHLIDIDKGNVKGKGKVKSIDFSKFEVPPEAKYAFAPPAGENAEVAYSGCDAFSLAVGLDLLNIGFKQTEVVILMRYLQPVMKSCFAELTKEPRPPFRERALPKDYKNLPVYEDGNDKWADSRMFVILQKIELTEVIPMPSGKRQSGPIIFEPIFCKGIAKLGAELFEIMPLKRRAVTVLELSETAQAIQKYLDKALHIPRGRPKT